MSEPLLSRGQIGDVILLFDKFNPAQHVLREPFQIGALGPVAILNQQSTLCESYTIDRQRQHTFDVIKLALDIIDHMIALV